MPEQSFVLDSVVSSLRAEQVERWQAGDRVLLEALLVQHPVLLSEPDVLLDLIYAEVLLREEHGDRPALAEYLRRFPAHEAALRRQFAFHDAFAALESGDTGASLPPAGDTTIVDSSVPEVAGRLPTRIGPYDILGEIGRGGMGVVYKGRHRTLKRLAAIKVLRQGEGTAEERQRFLTEARAVAALNHPNIVRIHEVFDSPGGEEPFVALEYMPGGSLEKKLSGTPLPPREAAALLLSLAEAIQHAHQAGVIHRDLKPANVLLSAACGLAGQPEQGPAKPQAAEQALAGAVPKVADFGLARQLESPSGQTRTGAILGTPSYMAPEQAQGRKDVGPAADVYGLGAILYECLTGRPPFRADTVLHTLALVVAEEPVPPRRQQPSVPRDLETICLKCLEKRPQRRYASAADLADDLRRFLNGEPIRARPIGMLERGVKWMRRRPATAALVVVSGLALVALVALWIGFTVQLDAQRRDALEQRDEAERQNRRARHLLTLSANAVDEIAVSVRAGKEEERVSSNPGSVLFKLACLYARASTTLRGDRDLVSGDRDRLAEQYAVSAVRLLNCAEQVGFFARPANRDALEKSAELAPLRDRADYRRFRARLR
jgi:serine/threonine protein kinase